MEARKVEDATYVEYKDFVRDLFAKSTSKPTPAFVLASLLERYIKNADVPYKLPSLLGGYTVINRDFTHTEDANSFLETSNNSNWIAATLTKIGTTQLADAIKSGTDFGLMLIPFFKAYPEYIHYLQNVDARKKVMEEAKLCPGSGSHAEWQSSFEKNHIDGKCSDDYEVLVTYAEQLPKTMAAEYAKFLLKQLMSNGRFPNETDKSAKRPETYPGIYAGWVGVALSKLAKHLEPNQKKDVCSYLVKTLEKTELKSLSNIGLCLALSTLATDDLTKSKTADRLHKYIGDQLRNKETGTDLVIEFQSKVKNVSKYMPLLFQAMHNLSAETKNQSKALVFEILLDKDYLYAYREGLSILFDWLEPRNLVALYEVMSYQSAAGLEVHQNFTDIIPLFWQRMIAEPGGTRITSAVDTAYIAAYRLALTELTAPNAYTDWNKNHQLVASGKAWETNTSQVVTQLKILISDLPSFMKTPKEKLIPQVLRGLPTFLPHISAHDKADICKYICASLLPPRCTNLKLNFVALQTALTLSANSSEADLEVHFNALLKMLKQQHTLMRDYMAGKPITMPSAKLINKLFTEVALQATHLRAEKIPSLMLFLESLGTTGDVIVDEKMQLVMGGILKVYPAKINKFFSHMAPVAEPVAPAPKPSNAGGNTE